MLHEHILQNRTQNLLANRSIHRLTRVSVAHLFSRFWRLVFLRPGYIRPKICHFHNSNTHEKHTTVHSKNKKTVDGGRGTGRVDLNFPAPSTATERRRLNETERGQRRGEMVWNQAAGFYWWITVPSWGQVLAIFLNVVPAEHIIPKLCSVNARARYFFKTKEKRHPQLIFVP